MNTLKNKTALITGGTTGIGLATAALFLREGARIVISGRRETEGQKAQAMLREISPDVYFIAADVSQAQDVGQLVSQTVSLFGSLDIAFNNAGIEGRFVPIGEAAEADYDQVMDINLKGVWLSCKYEIAQFKKQGIGGVIVNTSSWLARGAFAGSAIYSASKAAVDGLARALAVECTPQGIRINNIQPGYIETPMFDRFFTPETLTDAKAALSRHAPIGRLGSPDEVAAAVLWLASPASSFISGESILVDGGLAIGGQRL
ncbi:MAG TPA: glucose 1-dehydrogenase [Chitinophaga sp.]|uniref:SDR family NAD(P)-dependent oxidoreductase n=1 Tax=Chitinophaga sp. TaxID=1869181 RepID=UPI002C9BD2E4|nr:glucose 1-dehydrogenase [Chitinophaga sp.]HVI48076.1 glucose 1-dehydrogenase [Chitinophaga sp.]